MRALLGPSAVIADVSAALRRVSPVKRWVDDIMPLLTEEDPLGVDTFGTHELPPRRCAARPRDVPEEAGRRSQDHPEALGAARSPRPRPIIGEPADDMLPHELGDHVWVVHVQ